VWLVGRAGCSAFDAMNGVSLLVGGPSWSGRLISRRKRAGFRVRREAAQGERAAS
jgi:hypothetical protein